ncbi:hypothetical protein FKP32DRAFT_202583 [Trametes sanguinea]|nr:hypothetical protein FKP32DRAFT_202583 [Trametes sanguinea]
MVSRLTLPMYRLQARTTRRQRRCPPDRPSQWPPGNVESGTGTTPIVIASFTPPHPPADNVSQLSTSHIARREHVANIQHRRNSRFLWSCSECQSGYGDDSDVCIRICPDPRPGSEFDMEAQEDWGIRALLANKISCTRCASLSEYDFVQHYVERSRSLYLTHMSS